MQLKNADGESLVVKIIGYQYPKVQEHKYDANWLQVSIDVARKNEHWTASDPFMLTWEVADLLKWFEDIQQGAIAEELLDFVEPNLSFALIDTAQGQSVRVYFEMEARPSWHPHNGVLREDLWLEFPVEQIELHEVIQSLQTDLQHYPVRHAAKRLS